jgi:RND family efflux transporter MFP subunit
MRWKEINTDRCILQYVTACMLVFLFAAGCGQKSKQPPMPPPTVTIAQPIRREVTDFLELTGNTQAVKTVQLQARVAGYLDKILFTDGQLVKKDQLLFIIQQNTYQANLQQAESAILQQKAQLSYASTQLERYSKLLLQKAAAQSDVDNWKYQRDSAQANLISAEAKRDLARLDLNYTEVRAPFDGRIDRRLKDPGNLVGSGQPTVLAEVNQIDPIYVYFNISDQDLSRLTKEARWSPRGSRTAAWPLYVGLPDEEGYPHEGRLDFASIALTSTTGTLLLRGTLKNRDNIILPGLYTRVKVPIKKGPALLVPQEAVGYDQGGSFLLVISGENVVRKVSVRTGVLVENLRAIEEGISGNEWVVVKAVQKAIPGKKVTPEKLDPSKPPPGQLRPADKAKGRS